MDTDVIVVGAGLAGLTAAAEVADAGRRVVLRDLVRWESRNLFYSGAKQGSDSTWRFRNRLETQFPINHEKVTNDRTHYLLADWEWFRPIGGDPSERFANRQRIRALWGHESVCSLLAGDRERGPGRAVFACASAI